MPDSAYLPRRAERARRAKPSHPVVKHAERILAGKRDEEVREWMGREPISIMMARVTVAQNHLTLAGDDAWHEIPAPTGSDYDDLLVYHPGDESDPVIYSDEGEPINDPSLLPWCRAYLAEYYGQAARPYDTLEEAGRLPI